MALVPFVPPQLPSTIPCPIAFVDETPGDAEMCLGKPLSSYKGQEFNRMLRAAGIDRSACLITHVCDIPYHKDGEIRSICTKEPESEECLRFPGIGFLPAYFTKQLERLRAELEAAQPAIIVPMGQVALWTFTGVTNITASRGTVHRASSILPGAKLLPTFRPGFVLRQYKMRGTVIQDLRKALAESMRPRDIVRASKRELWLAPTLEDIREFLELHLKPSPLISCDIETAKKQITCVGFGASKERALTIPFVDYRKPDRSYWPSFWEELEAWDLVQEILDLPNPKLFQNGPYDCFYFLRAGLKVRNWREDTRLLHHALYPELPKSLAYMGSVYTYEGPWKLLRQASTEKRDA